MLAIMGAENGPREGDNAVSSGHLNEPARPQSRTATVESESEDEPAHTEESHSRSASPNPFPPEPPMQYQPYRRPDGRLDYRAPEDREPEPIHSGKRKPSFLAHLVGPAKDNAQRPPRYHPDRDYINEFSSSSDGSGGNGRKKKHDEEWLNGFLNNVAGEVRGR